MVKKSIRAAVVVGSLLAFANPAHATGSVACRGTINPDVRLDLAIGRLVGPVIAQARLSGGGTAFVTGQGGATIAQAWLEEHALHLDVVDERGTFYLARLRTWRRSARGEYSGSLRLGGRTHQVRCRVEEEA